MDFKEKILNNISDLIDKQNAKGMKKYGHSLEDCPPRDYDWQGMIIEELIDALQYQQKQMQELEGKYNNLRTLLDVDGRVRMQEQNKRYREAIDEANFILSDGEIPPYTAKYAALIHLRKALEESNND